MRNIAIRASAGTGKTYELAIQYIARVASGVLPAEIVATTFTRKAAGEILNRILARVAAAAQAGDALEALNDDLQRAQQMLEAEPTVLTQADCVKLLAGMCHALHRFNVSTIDALFVRALAAFVLEHGTGVVPTLIDEASSEARRLRTRALQEALASKSPAEATAMLTAIAGGKSSRLDIAKLDETFSQLHYLYITADSKAWSTLEIPPASTLPAPDSVAQKLDMLAAEAGDRRLQRALTTTAEAVKHGDWRGAVAKGPASKVLDGSTAFYNRPLDASVVSALQEVVSLCSYHLLLPNRQKTEAMRDLLAGVASDYAAHLREKDLIPFSHVPLTLDHILGQLDSTYIGYRIGISAKHVLLDEFQDTNIEQWRVLRRLLGITPGCGTGDERSVLCVGDTKQAIYGWRGGCAAIFDSLANDVDGIQWEYLNKSYRSSKAILEAVDAVFTNLGQYDDLAAYGEVLKRWTEHYRTHAAHYDLDGYVEVCFAPPEGGDADKQNGEDAEDPAEDMPPASYAEWVAERVAGLAQSHPCADIGVLTRTNGAASALALTLQARGLRTSQEGPGVLCDDPAVDLVLSAMHLADHPSSSAEAFHVYHSPLRIALGYDVDTPNARERVSLNLRQRLAARGYGETVSWLARELSTYGDLRTARRLTQLVEAAGEFDRSPAVRPADFVEWLRSRTVTDVVPERIRVMSLHQCKGLEFDIVVLPELDKAIDKHLPPVLVVRDGDTGPVQEIHAYGEKLLQQLSPQIRDALRAHRAREVSEALNLLYVGMTRARRALHLYLPARYRKQGDERPRKIPFSMAGIVVRTLGLDNAPRDPAYQHGKADWADGAAAAGIPQQTPVEAPACPMPITFNATRPRRIWPEASPSEAADVTSLRLQDALHANAEALDRGSVIHAWLQQIEWLDAGIPSDDALLETARPLCPGRSDDWLKETLRQFHSILGQPNTRSALTRPNESVRLDRERSFAVRLSSTLSYGRVDRMETYIGDAGISRIVITDFKTDAVELEALKQRTAHYQPQMTAYAKAIAETYRIPLTRVECRLLFVSPDELVTVGVEGGSSA